MVNFFLHIYDFLRARRLLCFGLLAVFVGGLLAMISTLRYNEDIYDFLPMDESQQKAITLYQDITGGQRIVAMVRMKEGGAANPDRLAEAVDTFTNILQSHSGARHIKDITAQVDFEKISGIADFAYHNLPFMLTDSDYVRMEHILASPEAIRRQLEQDVQQVMMPATGFFATSISSDPLGLFAPVMQRMQSRQASLPFEMENGYIFTADRQYAIVMMTSAYGSMESAGNTVLVGYVDSVSQATMALLPDVDVAITGSPVIAVDNASQIKADSRLAIAIAVVLILCLLIFSFRSARNLLLIGVSILFGWLFAMAFVAVLSNNVSLIVLGIGSIIIGIAVNYPLHFVAHLAHGGSVRDVLKDMVSPLLIGNITTVGAFACLIPLDAPALRDLGLFAAFMLIGTILFVLIFLPHLVRGDAHHGKERLLFGRIASVTPRIHRWTFVVIVVLTAVLGYFSLQTSFDADMHHINYLTPTQERLMADLHISAGVKDTSNVYIVSEGDSWDEALSERHRLAPLLDSLRRVGDIQSCTDATDFVCSTELQTRRLSVWNEFWNLHRREVADILQREAPQYGFSDDAFADFHEIVSCQYEPQPFSHFEPLVSALLSRSFSSSTGRCAVVDIADAGRGSVPQVEEAVNSSAPANRFSFDFIGMNSAVANSLSGDFNYIGFACGFIVFLFLWMSFGRLELSLLAFLPMAVGWIWILGIMNIAGMQFNIVNVILATFIFGQGDDYTIFMTDGLINEYAYRRKLLPSYKNSILISALIMFIGMGSLIVARHPALHSLAEVTIVGMLTVVVMAWIIPPMVFNWLIRTDGHVRSTPVTIGQVVRTAYCAVVYLFEVLYGCIVGLVVRLLPWRKEKNQAWLHREICRIMNVNIRCIWRVKTHIDNPGGEDFSRGSIIIGNHQSILDPILMLALSPRVLILISDKVWKNPMVHTLFKLAGFIPLNQSMEKLERDMAAAVGKGYSLVIFPEGKRNDEQITRFHKGAFHIAREIGADILPVFIHGASHVMPKGSGLAARGRIDLLVGQRIAAARLDDYGDTNQDIAHGVQLAFMGQYAAMRRRIETTHYFRHYLIGKYIYKGWGLEKETRSLLRSHDDFSQWIDTYEPTGTTDKVAVVNARRGQFPLMFALVHPDVEVHSFAIDPDDVALAQACAPLPANLYVHQAGESAGQGFSRVIDLSAIIQ